MSSVFVQTVIGEDSPDVIKSLAHATRQRGGEWLTTKVSKLDGQFAAMMKVCLEGDEAELQAALKTEFPDLHFSFAPARESDAPTAEPVDLVIDCADRPGLTRDLNKTLTDLDLHPQGMEFNRFPVSLMGKTVYSAKLSVVMPEGMTQEELEEQLKGVCEDMRVTIE